MAEREKQLGFDLDLAVMEDDALIVLAEECGYGPARDELIVRYDHQIDRLIGWLAYPTDFRTPIWKTQAERDLWDRRGNHKIRSRADRKSSGM